MSDYTLIPLVHKDTKLFPAPTMQALLSALGETAIDPSVLQDLVQSAVAQASSSGGAIHLGEGPPPDFIAGAKVKDIYIDQTNLTIYRLDEGV